MIQTKRFFLGVSFSILLLGFTSCYHTPAFNFGPYSEAEEFYKKGKYEKAIEKYQEHLKENPEGNLAVISRYYMAKSFDSLGRTGEARPLYQQIIQEQPKLIWADFSKSRLAELSPNSPSPPAPQDS